MKRPEKLRIIEALVLASPEPITSARLAAISIYQGQAESGSPEGPIRLRSTVQQLGAEATEIDWRARISDLM